jgi:tristetraprolin
MPSADSNSSCYSSSGSSTSSLSSPRVPITDLVQQEQHQPMRIPTTTTTITPPITQSHVCVTRYKTELCRPFTETGKCKYGDKCQFSHGMKELRNLNRHPKYKTEYCRTFHTSKCELF